MIGVVLGNGTHGSFIDDRWHPKGRLIDWVDPAVLSDIGATHNSMVADFVSEGEWTFPAVNDDNFDVLLLVVNST